MPNVAFRFLPPVTVNEDAPAVASVGDFPQPGDVPIITVDTSLCRPGDVLVAFFWTINASPQWGSSGGADAPGLIFSGQITANLGAFGGFSGGDAFIYSVGTGTSALHAYNLGPVDGNIANQSVAAVAACYSAASFNDYSLSLDARLSTPGPTPNTPSSLILPSEGALLTGQGLANDVTSFGTVSSPFTLRTSAIGRFSPTLDRYAQVQAGDLLDTGGGGSSFSPTWTNTNVTVTDLDKVDGVVVEGVQAYDVQLVYQPAPLGIHISTRF